MTLTDLGSTVQRNAVTKMCKRCGEVKAEEKFALMPATKDGGRRRRSTCNSCRMKAVDVDKRRARSKRYASENRERVYENGRKSRDRRRFTRSLERIRRAAEDRGHEPCLATENEVRKAFTGFCFVCGVHESELKTKLNLDHCHSTGTFRGWLCGSCNRALGYAGDSATILEKLIEYLRRQRHGQNPDTLAAPNTA